MLKTSWNPLLKAFCIKGCALRGVHPTTTKLFYLHYAYASAVHGPSELHAYQSNKQRLTRFRPGMRAGSLLDNELARTIFLRTKYELPVGLFCDNRNLKRFANAHKARMSTKDLLSLVKPLSLATLKVWKTFVKMQLTPLRAQVPVGDLNLMLGTAVDVECKNASNHIVIIDTKLGFQSYHHKHIRFALKCIVPAQTDSPCNQHQLQLLLTYELYRRSYATSQMGSAYIFRVDVCGVEVIPLQPWVSENAPRILQAVLA